MKLRPAKRYKDLPECKACYFKNEGDYQIFKIRNSITAAERERYRLKKGHIEYEYIGTLNKQGYLVSGYFRRDEEWFFGVDLKNAMRFMFLRSQDPKYNRLKKLGFAVAS